MFLLTLTVKNIIGLKYVISVIVRGKCPSEKSAARKTGNNKPLSQWLFPVSFSMSCLVDRDLTNQDRLIAVTNNCKILVAVHVKGLFPLSHLIVQCRLDRAGAASAPEVI